MRTTTFSLTGESLERSHSTYPCDTSLRRQTRHLVASRGFDTLVGFVILSNSVLNGVEQSYRLKDQVPFILKVIENAFLIFYVVELGLRFLGHGMKCLRDHWVKFDAALVVLAVLGDWVAPAIIGEQHSSAGLNLVLVMRMARLVRFARMLRLMQQFRELFMLLHGFLHSAKLMVYTMFLLGLMVYIFSLVAVEVVYLRYRDVEDSVINEEFDTVVTEYFSTLPKAMLTLVQFICLDSIGSIYRPLVMDDWTLSFYFISCILVIGIVLMNIVTAVIVNSALEQAIQNKESQRMELARQKKTLMKQLRNMFIRLDRDGSGGIDRDELANCEPDDKALLDHFMAGVASPEEVFKALDIDGQGTLDIDEFCDGIYQSVIRKTPIELKRIDKRFSFLTGNFNDSLAELLETTKTSNRIISHLARDMKQIKKKLGVDGPSSESVSEMTSVSDTTRRARGGDDQPSETMSSQFSRTCRTDYTSAGESHPNPARPFAEDIHKLRTAIVEGLETESLFVTAMSSACSSQGRSSERRDTGQWHMPVCEVGADLGKPYVANGVGPKVNDATSTNVQALNPHAGPLATLRSHARVASPRMNGSLMNTSLSEC